MSELDRDQDSDLPPQGSELGYWRFFIACLLGMDSPAFIYTDKLCAMFGPDYKIELESNLFLDHIGRIAFTNDREGAA